MIDLKCPNCQKKLRVREAAAGKKARCPGCGKVIRIGESHEQKKSARSTDLLRDPGQRKRQKKNSPAKRRPRKPKPEVSDSPWNEIGAAVDEYCLPDDEAALNEDEYCLPDEGPATDDPWDKFVEASNTLPPVSGAGESAMPAELDLKNRKSLVRCNECGGTVSRRAAACPRCGAPVSRVTASSGNRRSTEKSKKSGLTPLLCLGGVVGLCILVGGGMLVKNAIDAKHAAQERTRQEALALQGEQDRKEAKRIRDEQERARLQGEVAIGSIIEQMNQPIEIRDRLSVNAAIASLEWDQFRERQRGTGPDSLMDVQFLKFLLTQGYFRLTMEVSRADPFKTKQGYRLQVVIKDVETLPDRNVFRTETVQQLYDKVFGEAINPDPLPVLVVTEVDLSDPSAFTQRWRESLRGKFEQTLRSIL